MSNCDVVFLYDVHGIRRCFFSKSFARGVIMVSSAGLFFSEYQDLFLECLAGYQDLVQRFLSKYH